MNFLGKIFKKRKKKQEETISGKVFEAEVMRVKDIVAPASIKILPDRLMLGEKYTKSFFIFSYPRYLSTGWFSPVINLDTPMDISFFIHPIDTGLILKQLRKRVTEIQAELMEREEKGLVRDPALETAFRDIETLRNKLQTAQERMFRLGIYLTIYGNSRKELRDVEITLRSILESRLIYIKPALYQQKQGFISSSPYELDQLNVHTTMNTEPLSSVFPFISFDLSSNEGILYGINRHNSSLILFDRFTLENANSVVFAKSGSGKSIKATEPVLIKNNKGEIKLEKIGPLIEKIIKKQGINFKDEELEGTTFPDISVFTFDNNLKGEWSKVKIAARKEAPPVFYKFKTKSGREITTTGDHNMLVLRKAKVIAVKSSEIKEGEYIPLPRKIQEAQKPHNSLNLFKLLKTSKVVYIKGAEKIIQKNYQNLKKEKINPKYDKYLYKYRDGRLIPIRYFWQILKKLTIVPNKQDLSSLSVASRAGKGKLPALFQISNEFLRILGYILSEGTIGKNFIIISNIDKEVLGDIKSCFKKLKIPYFETEKSINVASSTFAETVKSLGGNGKSKEKKVCPFIFNLKKEKIAQYLSAYFEGDGGIEKNRVTVAASSKSKQLISEITYLLYYFGIIGRISKTKKKAANSDWKRKRIYYKLTISGQENLKNFAENINFISKRKKCLLSQIIKKQGNTNVDIVPEVNEILNEIYQILPQNKGWNYNFSPIKRKVFNPSRKILLQVIGEIEQRIQYLKELKPTFETLYKLPELEPIINLGKNNKKINRGLWQVLGQSWRVVKNEGVEPKSINAFKIIKAVNGNSYCLDEIKSAIYTGFQEMELPVKYYNRSLQSALKDRPKSNTNYGLIQKSAQFIWQNYQETLNNKIPQVEKKLTQLKILANSGLFWDPIVKIEKTKNKKEKHVYDLTVDNEVFLSGLGGMFVHNSYYQKLEILRSLMLGVDVIVIDPENEYRMLSDAVGGSYFKISLVSDHHINPFDLPVPREDENPENVLRTNVINLVGLLRIMLGGLSSEEDSIIDRALTETYAAKDITADRDFSKIEPPLMSDFQTVLEGMEGAESLVKRMKKFTTGTYSKFFNQKTNVSTKNNLVVFGIRDMEEELRPMAMYVILRYIWNTVRSELKKRILVVDEAWWIMQREDGASFLYGIAKRARKYWLGVTTITQDVGDFMRSSYGQPIITNSSLQFLMKQSPATIDLVKKTFNLTEEEKYFLLETAVGEGIFLAGQKHVAMKVVASYIEDQIITTTPEEILKIKKAKKELK